MRGARSNLPTTENSIAIETDVQAHSFDLRKELGLPDLVLAQLLIIIVADYMGTAVKAGAAHRIVYHSSCHSSLVRSQPLAVKAAAIACYPTQR